MLTRWYWKTLSNKTRRLSLRISYSNDSEWTDSCLHNKWRRMWDTETVLSLPESRPSPFSRNIRWRDCQSGIGTFEEKARSHQWVTQERDLRDRDQLLSWYRKRLSSYSHRVQPEKGKQLRRIPNIAQNKELTCVSTSWTEVASDVGLVPFASDFDKFSLTPRWKFEKFLGFAGMMIFVLGNLLLPLRRFFRTFPMLNVF